MPPDNAAMKIVMNGGNFAIERPSTIASGTNAQSETSKFLSIPDSMTVASKSPGDPSKPNRTTATRSEGTEVNKDSRI
jgi:hypothetical protein